MQIKLTVQQAIDLTGEIYKQMARQMQPPILPIVLDLPDNWTDTPPTEPGWYWGIDPLEICRVETAAMGSSKWKAGDMVIYADDQLYLARTWSDYWLGPLPEPTPPSVEVAK